jgi:hypothetical protein
MYMQREYNFYEVDNMNTLQAMYQMVCNGYTEIEKKLKNMMKENEILKRKLQEYDKNLHPFMD